MLSFAEEYTPEDVNIIKWQLGCRVVNISAVVERCKYGFPQIILLNPLESDKDALKLNYESISNIFWLTCPYLNNRIHELEDRGAIKKISDDINSDTELRLKMNDAHDNFSFLRKIIYLGTGLSVEIDLNRGVGGIRNIDTLKCLHIHYSHFRVCKDNVAGYITYNELGKNRNCDENMCVNAALPPLCFEE